jgi:hypothetical protein
MKKVIDFIIAQQLATIEEYDTLVSPLVEEFGIEASCAQSIIETVVEWELDPNTIDSLEELLIKRFPDFVTN